MNRKKLYLLGIAIVMLFSCLTLDKNVRYVRPAQINIPQNIKTFAIITSGQRFGNDMYNILLTSFSSQVVQQRFSLIDRANIERIIQEQRLYNTDFFDENTVVEIGSLAGAQAIIFGEISNIREQSRNGRVVINRRYVVDQKPDSQGRMQNVYEYRDEQINSQIREYSYNITLKIIDAARGTVIHSSMQPLNYVYETYVKPENTVMIKSSNGTFVAQFPSLNQVVIGDTQRLTENFTKDVAPHYGTRIIRFQRISMDRINETFIKLVDRDLYEEAFQLMTDSLDYINTLKPEDKAIHLYNLGNVYEIRGAYDQALDCYQQATRLNPTDLHTTALRTIRIRIEEERRLNDQINNG